MSAMGNVAKKRESAVADTVDEVRRIEQREGVTRQSLNHIAQALLRLADDETLFTEDDFPNPSPGTPARLYLLNEDQDGRFALYLTCAMPGGAVRPHNHNTWAVVAGLSGCEENFFYDRVSGGEAPGPAHIKLTETVRVFGGESVVMLPQDIHSVATPGSQPRRHFHMYGMSLERLTDRLAYDVDANSCAFMEINPKIFLWGLSVAVTAVLVWANREAPANPR